MPTQYTAQVCLNGHTTTDRYEDSPHNRADFCPSCGSGTITTCPNCNEKIKGELQYEMVFGGFPYTPPSYCYSCGHAFPWTQTAIDSAMELAKMSGKLSEQDIQTLQTDIAELANDTPKAQVAAIRTKGILGKVGNEFSGAMRSIIIEIVSEAIKKQMFP